MEALKVSIHFNNNFIVGSGYGVAGYLDDTVMKDENGLPYLPGTTLKGNIRQACVDIAKIAGIMVYDTSAKELKALLGAGKDLSDPRAFSPITQIFGSPYLPAGFEFYSAYMAAGAAESDWARQMLIWSETHNELTETGIAKPDHLFSHEVACYQLPLSGTAQPFWFPIIPKRNEVSAEAVALLVAGIRFVDRIGAKKSRGKGGVTLRIHTAADGKINGTPIADWISLIFPGKE